MIPLFPKSHVHPVGPISPTLVIICSVVWFAFVPYKVAMPACL
jgi:hypothetical protein